VTSLTSPGQDSNLDAHLDAHLKMCVDRPVTDEQQAEADQLATELRADNLRLEPAARQGGLGDPNPSVPGRARITFVKRYFWPVGQRLKVRFLDGDPGVQRRVEDFAQQWPEHANLTLDFGAHADADIRISFRQKGASWSYIGAYARTIPRDRPTMNFGWLEPGTADTEYSRVVLHEFGHAIGAIHEHQHPLAAIPWDVQAVYEYYMRTQGWSKADVDRNLFQRYSAGETNFSEFDPHSIMLYAIPDSLTIGTWSTGWNTVLSEQDKAFVGTIYPKAEPVVPELTVDGGRTEASIGQAGEIDAFRFTVDRAGLFVMDTRGASDVALSLWGPDDEGLLRAADDNSGRGPNARIVRKLQPGGYWLKVAHASPSSTGDYDVAVRRLR
jgi:hypothetical protein